MISRGTLIIRRGSTIAMKGAGIAAALSWKPTVTWFEKGNKIKCARATEADGRRAQRVAKMRKRVDPTRKEWKPKNKDEP